MSDLAALQQTFLDEIDRAGDEPALEAVRVAALGKKGAISERLKTLGEMDPAERRHQGPLINGVKERLTAAIAARRELLKASALEARLNAESVDVTLPVAEPLTEIGRVHPVTQTIDELTAIFADMGFAVAEGPDIETDENNFTLLNFPRSHPARDMLAQKPPIRVITPGRTYRIDSDQTHTPVFHQVEGLVIDKSSHLGHLRWILEEFCKAFFEVETVKMRFRPSYFPFTEPSLEVDIQCRREKDEIRFGEGEDWLEILGCGMVHPNVIRNCGLDPDAVQGFAWGMGI